MILSNYSTLPYSGYSGGYGATTTTTSTSGGSGGAGDLLGGLIGAATGTGIISSILGNIDIEGVLNTIVNWGASTSKEATAQKVNALIPPIIQQHLTALTATNVEARLKSLSIILNHSIQIYQHKAGHHFTGGSSHEGMVEGIRILKKFKADTLDKLVAEMRAKGVILQEMIGTIPDSELRNYDLPLAGDDKNLHQDAPVRYPYWRIDADKLFNPSIVDKASDFLGGTGKSQFGMGWMILLLGVGWFGFSKSGQKQRRKLLK